jgi:uncharacterized membrane protein
LQYAQWSAKQGGVTRFFNSCNFPAGDSCDISLAPYDLPSACSYTPALSSLNDPAGCEQALGNLTEEYGGRIAAAVITLIICTLLFLALALVHCRAWIGALASLARAQEWGWFWGVLLVSGLMLPMYIFIGPEPLTPAQAAYARGQRLPTSAPIPQQSSPALAVLQERYARGEIDTATYEEMRARLER